jgi:hypothetical protein
MLLVRAAPLYTAEERRAGHHRSKPTCRNFGQLPQFQGEWVDHPDPAYSGLYMQEKDCPAWGHDFDCSKGATSADRKPDLVAKEYRKVFRPHECELPKWDAVGFDR